MHRNGSQRLRSNLARPCMFYVETIVWVYAGKYFELVNYLDGPRCECWRARRSGLQSIPESHPRHAVTVPFCVSVSASSFSMQVIHTSSRQTDKSICRADERCWCWNGRFCVCCFHSSERMSAPSRERLPAIHVYSMALGNLSPCLCRSSSSSKYARSWRKLLSFKLRRVRSVQGSSLLQARIYGPELRWLKHLARFPDSSRTGSQLSAARDRPKFHRAKQP